MLVGSDQAKHAAHVTVSMGVTVFPGDGGTTEAR
jgi:hypothetical protein